MRRYLISALASMVIVAAAADASAFSPTSLSAGTSKSQVMLVQDRRDETLKQKVKRIWRDWTGYKFDVACPIFPIPLTRSTCTETGKSREEARAKCQARNPFCSVADARRS